MGVRKELLDCFYDLADFDERKRHEAVITVLHQVNSLVLLRGDRIYCLGHLLCSFWDSHIANVLVGGGSLILHGTIGGRLGFISSSSTSRLRWRDERLPCILWSRLASRETLPACRWEAPVNQSCSSFMRSSLGACACKLAAAAEWIQWHVRYCVFPQWTSSQFSLLQRPHCRHQVYTRFGGQEAITGAVKKCFVKVDDDGTATEGVRDLARRRSFPKIWSTKHGTGFAFVYGRS